MYIFDSRKYKFLYKGQYCKGRGCLIHFEYNQVLLSRKVQIRGGQFSLNAYFGVLFGKIINKTVFYYSLILGRGIPRKSQKLSPHELNVSTECTCINKLTVKLVLTRTYLS